MSKFDLTLQERFTLIPSFFHRRRQPYQQLPSSANQHRREGRILRLLQVHPDINREDIAYLLDMHSQSLEDLLAKLEHGGYISYAPSENDGQDANIRLTEKGMEEAKQPERERGTNGYFSCLSDEEGVKLAEYLDRIIADLEKHYGDEREDFDIGSRGRHNRRRRDIDGRRHGHDGRSSHHERVAHQRGSFEKSHSPSEFHKIRR